MVDQVHGTAILQVGPVVGRGDRWPVLGEADVIVSDGAFSTPVGVWAADCAPLALFGAAGTVVGAHAGWRGLAAGVVDVAVGVLSRRDESVVAAVAGPMIHAGCYAFGDAELAAVADGVGAEVPAIAAVTSDGRVALDVPAAVAAALGRHDIKPDVLGGCTGCDRRWFSHRVCADTQRHVLVAWTEPARGTVEQ